jgi:hypothetical protein
MAVGLELHPGPTVANLTRVYADSGIDWSGGVLFYNGGGFAKTTELIVDVFGYYANP